MKNHKPNTNNKAIIFSIIGGALLIAGSLFFAQGRDYPPKAEPQIVNNVSIVDGVQIVELKAKGGFNPLVSNAKADMPTILRIKTRGTFDCSSFVRIPSLDITKNLPATGTTDIDLGIQETGTLYGSCSMGMYPFEIRFE